MRCVDEVLRRENTAPVRFNVKAIIAATQCAKDKAGMAMVSWG